MLTGLALRMVMVLQGARAIHDGEDGQTLSEYGLIISLVGVAIIVLTVIVFRDTLTGAFAKASFCLNGSC